MLRLLLIFLSAFTFAATALQAQNTVEPEIRDSIVKTGQEIYRLKTAGDLGIAKLARERSLEGLAGFVTYRNRNLYLTSFYRMEGDSPVVVATTSTSEPASKDIDVSQRERAASPEEAALIAARNATIQQLSTDTGFFTFYQNMAFQPVLLPKQGRVEVYLLPTFRQQKEVAFGNDYLLVFDQQGKLISRQPLHQSLTMLQPQQTEQGHAMGAVLQLEKQDSPLPAPTDIARVLLVRERVGWDQIIFLSPKYMSIFYLNEEGMAVFPAGAFGK